MELQPNSIGKDKQKIIDYVVETMADNIEKYSTTKTDTVIRPDINMETTLTNKTDALRTEVVNASDVLEYVEENVSMKVVKIIQSYTSVLNKMVWRKL